MRRLIFILLTSILAALVAARAALPEPEAVPAAAAGSQYGYNIQGVDLPLSAETAGSAMIAEMNGYYLFREPTAKNALTGLLRGRSLILICAGSWAPNPTDGRQNPCLQELWRDGIRFSRVYRPDWYQGSDGVEFALLSGLMPTRVNDETALQWTGEQGIYLPYALARCLAAAGYDTRAFLPSDSRRDAYEAMGFSAVTAVSSAAGDAAEAAMEGGLPEGPFFYFLLWPGTDGEAGLARLREALDDAGRREDTALCLLTGNREEYHGQWFLWAEGVKGIAADIPCSELDVTPTLLNLMGAAYDSRFLSGRDVFAENAVPGQASAVTPLVSLYGSAYSDWVTDAGCYIAADSVFWPDGVEFEDTERVVAYVQAVCSLVYDRYIFARRVMENNYFHLVPGL